MFPIAKVVVESEKLRRTDGKLHFRNPPNLSNCQMCVCACTRRLQQRLDVDLTAYQRSLRSDSERRNPVAAATQWFIYLFIYVAVQQTRTGGVLRTVPSAAV